MPVRSETWGCIGYLAFFGFFISLVAVYWVYSYEIASNLGGSQMPTNPYRGFTIILVLVSILFFGISVYSRIRERRTSIEAAGTASTPPRATSSISCALD